MPGDPVSAYKILVDGTEIADQLSKRIREVRVLNYLRLPDLCTLSATYPKAEPDKAPAEDEDINNHPFKIGKSLEVKLGGPDDSAPKTLFKGQITSNDLDFGAGGIELTVRSLDGAHVLLRGRNSKTYQSMTASDIVQQVAGAAGFSAQVDASDIVHEFMQQDNETDWDFIWRLAERVGFEFVVDGSNAHFRKQTVDNPIELEWPNPLHAFKPKLTATQQAKTVSLSIQDPKTKQAITSSQTSPELLAEIGVKQADVSSPFKDSELHIATEAVKTQSEADGVAKALLNKLANAYISAEGVCNGNPDIKAGAAVKVTGIAEQYCGVYRVTAATHILRGGGTYETHFANDPGGTILASVGGDRGNDPPDFSSQLVIGLVTQTEDPDGMGRVRVKYPSLSDDLEGWWARIASVSAGNARGLTMMPVVGEEVLVGFEHNDTTRPYVLGSLYNGTDKPGDELLKAKKADDSDGSSIDGSFSLLSDHNIWMHAKEELGLKTDGNMGAISKGKLTMKVTQDTELTVDQGKIEIKTSMGDITFDSGQGVTIKGAMNVEIQGQSGVKLECGGSSIEMTPASIKIAAPMVNIGS